MKSILIVDDENDVRESISAILRESGYSVITAGNGREGLVQFAEFKPDIVLTDISMPDMEGIEFLRTIRAKNRETPVIVMSGHAVGTKFLKAASLFGASTTLKKPFSRKELLEMVEDLIQ